MHPQTINSNELMRGSALTTSIHCFWNRRFAVNGRPASPFVIRNQLISAIPSQAPLVGSEQATAKKKRIQIKERQSKIDKNLLSHLPDQCTGANHVPIN